MIKIITTLQEKNTNEVIDYLLANNINFERINYENFFPFSYNLKNGCQNATEDVFWHRRGRVNFNPKIIYPEKFKRYILGEEKILVHAFESLNSGKYFGSYVREENQNKIIDLSIASKKGLKIPNTLVTNNKKDLLEFLDSNKKIITKSLNYSFTYLKDEILYFSDLTIRVNKKEIEGLSDFFLPSFFQEYIEKLFEIRVFYFDNSFYSMAIFSQNNSKTKVDYRNYNLQEPNRNIPFKLPMEIKKKLSMFIKEKKSNTGSIDIIYSKKREFVFLEDNPMGQYDWLSKNCNYYIEKRIFENLTDEKNI